jgi:hypothetical protein
MLQQLFVALSMPRQAADGNGAPEKPARRSMESPPRIN